MYGYSMEELYGFLFYFRAKYGFRHSPAVKREIAKDSIMFTVGLLTFFMYTLWWRWERNETEATFDAYLNNDRHTLRDNLK